MAGLTGRGAKSGTGRGLATVICLAVMVGALAMACKETLDLKSLIRQQVELSKVGLVLYDGTARIMPGETVSFSDTIFGDTYTKVLTLRNDGDSNVALTSPLAVTKTGGGGAVAYGNVVQPAQATLLPGDSATFSIDYTPPAADSTYVGDFVVNSNDGSHPAYAFHGSGRSTQWHGSLAAASSPVSAVIDNPQIVADGSYVYLSFMPPSADTNDILVRRSADGGKTWAPFAAALAGGPFPHVLASRNGEPHVFHYKDTATTGVHYGKWLDDTNSWHPDIESRGSVSHDPTTAFHGSMLVSGYVFLAWFDAATASLLYNFSMDPRPAYPSGVLDSFMSSPATLAGGATGRTGGILPCLARDSAGNLYVLYADNSATPGRLWLLKTSSSGLNFATLPTACAGPSAAGNAIINQCQLALVESGSTVTIHVFWSQGYDANAIYHASSADLASWTASARIGADQNNRYGKTLPVAVDGGGVIHLLHENGYSPVGIVLSTSADGGATWVHRVIDADPSFAVFSASLSLAASDRTIYAAYSTGSAHANGYSITIMKSLDGGASW